MKDILDNRVFRLLMYIKSLIHRFGRYIYLCLFPVLIKLDLSSFYVRIQNGKYEDGNMFFILIHKFVNLCNVKYL